MNTAMSNHISKQNNRTDVQANIHEIADRLYPGSDTWVCKNCTHKRHRFDLINHVPYCKNNNEK